MTRTDTKNAPQNSPPAGSLRRVARLGTSASAALFIGLSLTAVACGQVRYTESFRPDGDIERVVVVSDAGTVEVVPDDDVRVQRAVRAPEGAVALSHVVEDGTLTITAACVAILPCAVDVELGVPSHVPVSVDVGTGEVWATGIEDLTIQLGEGSADVDVGLVLSAQVGEGTVRASLSPAATARVAVGSGDIDVSVPQGKWNVSATAASFESTGIELSEDRPVQLELVAPSGHARVHGTTAVAMGGT